MPLPPILCPWRIFILYSEVKATQVVSGSLQPHGLYSPWNSPGQILEWVAFPFSRKSSQPRDWTPVSCTAGRFFTSWATGKPWNNGAGSLSHLQRIFPTQDLNPGRLQCRRILYQLSYQGTTREAPGFGKLPAIIAPFLQDQSHSIFELLSSISLWPLLPLSHHRLWLQPSISLFKNPVIVLHLPG